MTVVSLRLFAQARETAGCTADEFDAATLGDLLDAARARYGPAFADVLERARVWVNGDDAISGDLTALHAGDEIAVLPPVSGG